MRNWQGLSIQNEAAGFIILKGCNLYWFSKDSDEPEATIKQCIPEEDRYKSFCTILSLCVDNVLIRIGDRFTVVNRNHGVVWQGGDLSSVTLRGQRAVAQYTDGRIEVIQSDGSMEMRCVPDRGQYTIAADIMDNVLNVAYASDMTERLRVKMFNLRM